MRASVAPTGQSSEAARALSLSHRRPVSNHAIFKLFSVFCESSTSQITCVGQKVVNAQQVRIKNICFDDDDGNYFAQCACTNNECVAKDSCLGKKNDWWCLSSGERTQCANGVVARVESCPLGCSTFGGDIFGAGAACRRCGGAVVGLFVSRRARGRTHSRTARCKRECEFGCGLHWRLRRLLLQRRLDVHNRHAERCGQSARCDIGAAAILIANLVCNQGCACKPVGATSRCPGAKPIVCGDFTYSATPPLCKQPTCDAAVSRGVGLRVASHVVALVSSILLLL